MTAGRAARVALVGGTVWNVLLPVCTSGAGCRLVHGGAVVLAVVAAGLGERRVAVREDHPTLDFVTLLLTAAFASSFLVPASLSSPPGDASLVSSVHRWASVVVVVPLCVWWIRHLWERAARGPILAATGFLLCMGVALGSLSGLGSAPREFVLAIPILGAIGVVPILALWRWRPATPGLVLRPVLTDVLLLVPLLPAVCAGPSLVEADGRWSALRSLTAIVSILVGVRLLQHVALLVEVCRLHVAARALGKSPARLARLVLRARPATLTPQRAWRLGLALARGYDGPLRMAVARAAKAQNAVDVDE